MNYAANRIIDSVWTVGFDKLSNGKLFIHTYDRENPIGYEQEKDLPACRPIEDEQRRIIGLAMGKRGAGCFTETHRVEVANPQNIFSYKA